MKSATCASDSPVTLESGPCEWQILQQDGKGMAGATLGGRWRTILKRKRPEVRIRVCREGSYTPIKKSLDWALARTVVDHTVKGEQEGRSGTWKIVLRSLPCGGPYRVDTCIGSAEDPLEWRREGESVKFLGVGDVWLIAGQSNAEGYGRNPVDDPAEIGVHQFGPSGCWVLASHGIRHNPWLSFAKQLKKELGYPIGLIPTAVGGTPISRWTPGKTGDLFRAMADKVEASGGAIRGCLWYQGESDVHGDLAAKYKSAFTRFLAGLRRMTKCPQLPVITVQLNRATTAEKTGEGWETIREIQRRLPHELSEVYVFPVFEAGLCDLIHTSSLGNLLVAQRAATTALGGVYGRDVHYRHPECISARQVSGTAIELRFEHVVTRLDYSCALVHGFPFAVRDREGEVPVAGYSLPRKDCFRIELARPLAGPATVTGAPGICPPQIVPTDINGYRGMLGFTMEVRRR